MDHDLYPPRIVKPRARMYKHLPVVVIDGPVWLDENGETGDTKTLIRTLPGRIPTLFAAEGSADLLAEIDEYWFARTPKEWQWRSSENERVLRDRKVKVSARVTVSVHFFGFKNGNKHKLIDPVTMYAHRLDTIWPGPEDRTLRLLQWAITIRNFCDENQIEVRPTIGSISAQFLTDRRFYPHPRRKVPVATNEQARNRLPGNHYALTVHPTPKREYQAWYIDQTRAHHYHVRTIRLPHADSLYAYGNFHTLTGDFIESPDDLLSDGFSGLYCLHLCLPRHTRFNWIRDKGKRDYDFVFSNELQHLYDLGYSVNGVYAAWGSFVRDEGLPRYAQWAETQLDRFDNAPWLKPLLLATYGTLATRAGYGETVFKLAKSGNPVTLTTGHRTLSGTLVSRKRKLEPGIANVIHRGMIEAATRSESIGLAQHLENQGFHVLSIYADAVIVRQDDDHSTLPLLPEPWRVKTTLNHLQFINQQAFISGEMTKLPGVGRELRDYQHASFSHAPRGKKEPDGTVSVL